MLQISEFFKLNETLKFLVKTTPFLVEINIPFLGDVLGFQKSEIC